MKTAAAEAGTSHREYGLISRDIFTCVYLCIRAIGRLAGQFPEGVLDRLDGLPGGETRKRVAQTQLQKSDHFDPIDNPVPCGTSPNLIGAMAPNPATVAGFIAGIGTISRCNNIEKGNDPEKGFHSKLS